MRKQWGFLAVFLGGIAAASTARVDLDEFDLLRARWKEMLTGGSSYDPNDPDIARAITGIDRTARDVWTRMNTDPNRTFLWSDLSSTTDSSQVTSNYGRLKSMALAYSTLGSSLRDDPMLLSDLIGGLDWMYVNRYNTIRPQYDNWWDWEIGTPLNLNDIVVLIYEQLSDEQIANYMAAIERFTPAVTRTAANRVWKATVVAVRGVIVKSDQKLAAARDGLSDVPTHQLSVFAYVNSGDGFYTDGSFIQHGRHPYTGGYGISLLGNLALVMNLLNGSRWQLVDPDRQNVFRWIYDSFEPLIYDGGMMSMVRGREISRTGQDHGSGHSAIQAIIRAAQFAPPADSAAYKSMAKYWILVDGFRNFFDFAPIPMIVLGQAILSDPEIAPRGELIGHKRFPRMDRVVHLQPGFGFAVSMSSNRIYNYECINTENLHGWYTGDGMTYLFNADQGQYSQDFWPTVNPYRLAGTTVDTRSRGDCDGQGYASPRTWAGGTDILGAYGASGMELKAFESSLVARKSWFMFDNEIVALGSGINSTGATTIETTIENRRLNASGDNALIVDGELKPSTLGWSEDLSGVSWISLDGTGGYYFPGSVDVRAVREARTGSWRDINHKTGSSTQVTRNYLTLWLDHGVAPADASYAYVLLPNSTADQVAAYAANPDIVILENSSEAHAVRENTLNIVAANFWGTGGRTVDLITVDRQASVMTGETDGQIEVALSDPTQTSASLFVELAREGTDIVSADPEITVLQLSPTIQLTANVNNAKGKTRRCTFQLVPPPLPLGEGRGEGN